MNKKTWISTLAIATVLGASLTLPATASAHDGYERGHAKTNQGYERRKHDGYKHQRRNHGNRHHAGNRYDNHRRWAPPRNEHRSHKWKRKHGHRHGHGHKHHRHDKKWGHVYGKRKHRHEHRLPLPPMPVKRSRGHGHRGDDGVSVHIEYGFTL